MFFWGGGCWCGAERDRIQRGWPWVVARGGHLLPAPVALPRPHPPTPHPHPPTSYAPQVAASAAVFAAAHLQPGAVGQLAVVGAWLGGVALATRGNLAACTTGHALYNAAVVLLAASRVGAL